MIVWKCVIFVLIIIVLKKGKSVLNKSRILSILSLTILVLLYFVYAGFAQNNILNNNLPDDLEGWFKAGSKPGFYVIGKDSSVDYKGKAPLYIKSTENVTEGFGTIMNGMEAKDYIGKRLRLTGYIKTNKIDGKAGMWMRIDSKEEGKMLGFDNMWDRPIEGTTDWTKYEIVLDVPKKSKFIAYGVLINQNGQAWLADFAFDVVSNDVPVTNILPADK